jgi:hypothetical protein
MGVLGDVVGVVDPHIQYENVLCLMSYVLCLMSYRRLSDP